MESQKICPLLLAARLTSAGLAVAVLSRDGTLDGAPCRGSACAWYDCAHERCAILSLARCK